MKNKVIPTKNKWDHYRLGDLCEVNIGRTPSRSRADYWGSGNKWLSIADMNQGADLFTTKEYITDLAVKECNCYQAPIDTVLLSFKLSIGKVGISRTPLYTNEAIAALPVKNKDILNTRYLFWALQSIDLTKGLDRAAKGLTLNKAKLLEVKIPLPSNEEQKRIADILDKADALRAKRREAITLLNSLTQSIFLEMFGDPIKNPKKWEMRPLSEVYELINGRAFKTTEWSEKGKPIIRIQNLKNKTSKYNFFEGLAEKKYEVLPGDILFSWAGQIVSIGCYIWDGPEGWLNQHIFKVLPKLEMRKNYTAISLNQIIPILTTMTQGVDMVHLTKETINKFKIPVPPIKEQILFESRILALNKYIELSRSSQLKTEELFDSFQQSAFSGKL